MKFHNLKFVKCVEREKNAYFEKHLSLVMSEQIEHDEGYLTVFSSCDFKEGDYRILNDNGKKYVTIVLPLSDPKPKK